MSKFDRHGLVAGAVACWVALACCLGFGWYFGFPWWQSTVLRSLGFVGFLGGLGQLVCALRKPVASLEAPPPPWSSGR